MNQSHCVTYRLLKDRFASGQEFRNVRADAGTAPLTRFAVGRLLFQPPANLFSSVLAILILTAAGCVPKNEKPVAPQVEKGPSGIEMVLIPAGQFAMGSDTGAEDEQPAHAVKVGAFLMDRTEITQEQYDKFALGNPSHFKGPTLPVEQISWADAALFCNARSRAEGLEPCYDEETAQCNFAANGYRLPTEAEWEYACRAGSDGDYPWGQDPRALDRHAWFANNAGKKTHPVAQKQSNARGLYDMHGNVAEWCNDIYDDQYYTTSPSQNPTGPAEGERYVLRGGAWNCSPAQCRSATRVGAEPGFQDACFARDAVGFRCVRSAEMKKPEPSNSKQN